MNQRWYFFVKNRTHGLFAEVRTSLPCKIIRAFAPSMPVAKLVLELSIPHAHSLKDRRQVVRSLKEKLRHGFNISVAELDDASLWNRATLGFASISASTAYLNGQMQEVESTLQRLAPGLGAQIEDSWMEILDSPE